ncbi:unnamed protein product [Ectocarpus sp. 13 AM-2016]
MPQHRSTLFALGRSFAQSQHASFLCPLLCVCMLSNPAAFPLLSCLVYRNHVAWQPDWTEEYVESLFSSIVGQELEVKLIRDRHRGIVAGYGFIDFRNHETAQLVLDSLNGKPIEGTSLRYRLNWGAGGKRIEQAPEYSVFVGDLSPEVTDAELKATFLDKYASVLGAKVVTNPMTGSSKSFGFIRFGDEQERDEALTAMNGAECCGRPIRVAPATKRTSVQGMWQTGAHATDPSNTTVFVGGINDSVTEKVLRDTFNSAGEIQTVTTPPGRGCAFVTFAHRASAEHVINNMQGTTVCGSCVRLSWGKSGRADRDRERERAGGDPIMGMGGIQSSPTAAAAAAAAAAARGAPFSGLYGHPQSYASFNGAYPANLFPAGAVYGGAYPQPGQQQPGLPPPAAAGTGQQLPQPQQPQQPHQHQQAAQQQAQQQVAAQQQQQQQAAQQQYAQQPYSQQSYAPYQGFGFQQYPAQQQAAYTSFNGTNTAYAQDPSALANDLSQLSLSGGAASAVGSTSGGASVGGGGRAARVGGSRSGGGGGGGMYGPASRSGGQGQGPGQGQGGQGPSFSLQDVRKGGLGPASRN